VHPTALDVVMVGINGELTTSKAMVLSEMGGFLSHLEREQLGERSLARGGRSVVVGV